MTPIRSADELSPGMSFDLGTFVLAREEVLDFARKFDPQPFHLDDEAAKASIFGRLVASGMHTLSAAVAHLLRSGLLAEVNLGAGGMQLNWPAPLDPDTPVRLTVTVEAVRASRSKPEMAVVTLRYAGVTEPAGATVLDLVAPHFMRR
ncbi:MaoC/PaaZ C-terminal domain-containing protein [Falsiroseomonas sp. HW251]|uniref:MaoC/PaaZ C-terminal domain-containing protein n=1 Tax=Falsiroseomonas sp. HW251 TaxID=3390998 RepID=UPI003D322075